MTGRPPRPGAANDVLDAQGSCYTLHVMNPQLSIHHLPRLQVRDTVTHQGQPCEVTFIAKNRKSLRLRNDDGEIRVTREELELKAQRMQKAQKAFRREMQRTHETPEFLYVHA